MKYEKRLNRIAKYLAANDFYKEADVIKKIATNYDASPGLDLSEEEIESLKARLSLEIARMADKISTLSKGANVRGRKKIAQDGQMPMGAPSSTLDIRRGPSGIDRINYSPPPELPPLQVGSVRDPRVIPPPPTGRGSGTVSFEEPKAKLKTIEFQEGITLKPGMRELVQSISKRLSEMKDVQFKIVGYSDRSEEQSPMDVELAQRRAEMIKDMLRSSGAQMTTLALPGSGGKKVEIEIVA